MIKKFKEILESVGDGHKDFAKASSLIKKHAGAKMEHDGTGDGGWFKDHVAGVHTSKVASLHDGLRKAGFHGETRGDHTYHTKGKVTVTTSSAANRDGGHHTVYASHELKESLDESVEQLDEGDRGDYHDAKKISQAYAVKDTEPHPDNYHKQHILSVHKDRVDTLHKKLKEHGFTHQGIMPHGGHRYTRGKATVDITSKPEHDKHGWHQDSGEAKDSDHHQVVVSRKD